MLLKLLRDALFSIFVLGVSISTLVFFFALNSPYTLLQGVIAIVMLLNTIFSVWRLIEEVDAYADGD